MSLKENPGTSPISIVAKFKSVPLPSDNELPSYSVFQLLLHRKLLLTHLEFLSCCVELRDDAAWCIAKWKESCQCIEDLNSHMVTPSYSPTPIFPVAKITLANVCDTLVNQRGHSLSHSLIQSSSDHILELVKFERCLIKGILALLIGYTSLLDGIHGNVHLLLGSVTSWEECSSVIGTEWVEVCCQLEGRVWQNAGQRLIATIRMLPGARQAAIKETFTALSSMSLYYF